MIKPSQARLRKWLHQSPLRVQADVFYTCKALHKVGSEVLYSQNASTSEHKHAYQADQWLARIGSVNLGLVKSLAFSYNLRLFGPACLRGHDYLRRKQGVFGTLLRDASKLYTLTMDLSSDFNRSESIFIDCVVTLKALCAMPSLKAVTINTHCDSIGAFFAYYLNLRTGFSMHNNQLPVPPRRLQSRQITVREAIQGVT